MFLTGFKHKPEYFMLKIPKISNQLKQLEEIVSSEFISAISNGISYSDIKRKLLSFSPKLREPGLPISSKIAEREYKSLNQKLL